LAAYQVNARRVPELGRCGGVERWLFLNVFFEEKKGKVLYAKFHEPPVNK
jgi:hypothetical protein